MPDLPTRYAWIKPGVRCWYRHTDNGDYLVTIATGPKRHGKVWYAAVLWPGKKSFPARCTRLTPRTEETDDAR